MILNIIIILIIIVAGCMGSFGIIPFVPKHIIVRHHHSNEHYDFWCSIRVAAMVKVLVVVIAALAVVALAVIVIVIVPPM